MLLVVVIVVVVIVVVVVVVVVIVVVVIVVVVIVVVVDVVVSRQKHFQALTLKLASLCHFFVVSERSASSARVLWPSSQFHPAKQNKLSRQYLSKKNLWHLVPKHLFQ